MAGTTSTQNRTPAIEVQTFLATYSPDVQGIALKLREMVFDVAPEAIEQVDIPGKLLAYGFARTYKDMICVIMPLKAAVNFGLPRGAELPDPDGLLEGTGKRARHVKVANVAQAGAHGLRALLKASIGQLQRHS